MSILRHPQIDPYDTSSFLTTASINLNTVTFTKGDGSTFPITINTGSAGSIDTSSLLTTASIDLNTITFTKGDGSTFNILVDSGSFSGSFYGTASWAQSASFALTASAAPLDTYIQYNKNGLFGAEQYFRYIYTSHSLQQGYDTIASGQYSHAEGGLKASNVGTLASGDGSHAEGVGTLASGNGSHAEGIYTQTLSYGSHAEGNKTTTLGEVSHAEGSETVASGNYSHAEGYLTIALGSYSHAEGGSFTYNAGTLASGEGSHAEGVFTTASGNVSHAEGYGPVASGLGAHAEGGGGVVAQGIISHAEGSGTRAEGYASHAEGHNTTASGDYSHAEGYLTKTINDPNSRTSYSHAEGEQTLASGRASHAEGYNTTASGNYSHTAGHTTIALGQYQSVIGQFNITNNSQSAFIIGDGDNDNNRHNVLFVSKSHFEISASNVFLQGISISPETNILVYNSSSGQVYYTASSAFGGGSSSPIVSLPAPKVLLKGTASIEWFSGSNEVGGILNLDRAPYVIANDISLEVIDTYPTFVEMVYYKTNRKGKSWVVPVSNVNIEGTYTNTLETILGVPLKTRGGNQKYKIPGSNPRVYNPLQINRPNHYQVTSSNQIIPAHEYLNGYFTKGNVLYRFQSTPSPDFKSNECTFPYFTPQIKGTKIGAGYSYSNIYSPLYIAFRYILWDINANNGLGDFTSGPLSKTIAVAAEIHPFITDKDNENVLIPIASVNSNYNNDNLKCWFDHKI